VHIVALANQKGGVGKTAITTNLGCQAAALGAVAVVLDLDHPQRSTMRWGARREADNPLVAEASASTLGKTLEAMRECGSASKSDPPSAPDSAKPSGATLRFAPPALALQHHNLDGGQLFDADPGQQFGAV
jgi:CO dehydrogenase nickel-insertion accessory protein CooC1